MSERPSVPAELRRRVLVEAGHRCAIHTCRHVDVDIHHIEAWAQCREHRFDNLIALCPNCHRRAEEGKIDRKSLRLYKARLAAAFHFEEVNFYPEEIVLPTSFAWVDPSGEWTTDTIVKEESGTEVSFEYPQFRDHILGAPAEDVNQFIRNYVNESIKRFVGAMAGRPSAEPFAPHNMQSSFSVTLIRPPVLSLRFTMTAYAGGAHGSHWTETHNLFTVPMRLFNIEELFTDAAAGLAVVSDYAIQELLAPSALSRDERWVREGAGPDPKNFQSFNLTGRGILLTFDEYQVGSYAEGAREVHVPYHVVTRILNPTLAGALGHEV